MIKQKSVNPTQSTLRDFEDISHENPLQYYREFVQNSLEAGAKNILITFDQEAWDKYHVARTMFVDDGEGFLKPKFEHGVLSRQDRFHKMLHSEDSSKSTEGSHNNFGVGAKVSCRGFNKFGQVVISWNEEFPEGLMCLIRYDEGCGQFCLMDPDPLEGHTFLVDQGEVTSPYYSQSLMTDFSRTIASIKKNKKFKNKGTAIILCGEHPFDSTSFKDARGGVQTQDKFINFLNTRFFRFNDDVTITHRLPVYPRTAESNGGGKFDFYHKKHGVFQTKLQKEWERLRDTLSEEEMVEFYNQYCKAPSIYPNTEVSFDSDISHISTLIDLAGASYLAFESLRQDVVQTEAQGSVPEETDEDIDEVQDAGTDTTTQKKKIGMKSRSVEGFKKVLENPANKAITNNGTLSKGGFTYYWYILNNDKTTTNVDSHMVASEHRKGVQILYQDELFQHSSKPKVFSQYGIPDYSVKGHEKGDSLRDRIKIFVEYPKQGDDKSYGVSPVKGRTKLKWGDWTDGKFNWDIGGQYWTDNLPTEIADLIEEYAPPMSGSDVTDLVRQLSSVWEVTPMATPSTEAQREPCSVCGNKNRCSCKCSICKTPKSEGCSCTHPVRQPNPNPAHTREKKYKVSELKAIHVDFSLWKVPEDNPHLKFPDFVATQPIKTNNEYRVTCYKDHHLYTRLQRLFPEFGGTQELLDILNSSLENSLRPVVQERVVHTIMDYETHPLKIGHRPDMHEVLNSSTLQSCFYPTLDLFQKIEEKLYMLSTTADSKKAWKAYSARKKEKNNG